VFDKRMSLSRVYIRHCSVDRATQGSLIQGVELNSILATIRLLKVSTLKVYTSYVTPCTLTCLFYLLQIMLC